MSILSVLATRSSYIHSDLLLAFISIVAIIVLIVSLVMAASHKKKRENQNAMKLFEDIQKDSLENEK